MEQLDRMILEAIREDMPSGDVTTDALFTDQTAKAHFIAKQDGVISGLEVARRVFSIIDPDATFEPKKQNGDTVRKGEVIAIVYGRTASILKAERIALNFLQRMSGIATKTAAFVAACAGTSAAILDTRKTTPTLRFLEKRAVLDGGGKNHRMSLSDMAMIKDNHIKAAGSISAAVAIVRAKIPAGIQIEVEVESVPAFQEALGTDCDIVMLDNMATPWMAECVRLNAGKKKLEASGNMTLSRIPEVAATGVDYISVGALTHSFESLDVSLRFQ
ncbi:MAG: carboxylating nicotinate-nucleotide diphosphorylase [Bacillota bacterium]|nr:carboxylating nicotinate-nucleotide diphosphorylase [Bacillota bacterium]